MISIDKTSVAKPNILDYKNKTFLKNLNKIIENRNGENVSNLYKHAEVKEKIEKLYHNKCAYCEEKINNAHFTKHIDHFRPKNKITGVENHKGYYWLAYEWSNLLPTCQLCNIPKSNKFPVPNKKRISDNLEKEDFIKQNLYDFEKFNIRYLNKKEDPFLLNLETDEVEKYFVFLGNGKIIPVKNSEKAEKTIEILKLNRPNLIISRKKYIEEQFSILIKLFIRAKKDEKKLLTLIENQLIDIKYLQDKHQKYSRLGYFVFFLFKEFIIKRFRDAGLEKHAKILEKIYNEFILQNTNEHN